VLIRSAFGVIALLVANPVAPPTVASLLPHTGTVDVEVLRLTAPDPFARLSARFAEAVQKNQEWWLQRVKTAGPGTLPWHPNMGLTKAEYEQYLALMEDLRYEPAARATITVQRQGQRVVLDGGDDLADLWEVTIDPVAMSVDTPLGGCSRLRPFDSSAKATGPWTGFTCRETTGDPTEGDARSVVLHLGRLAASGNVFFSLEAKRFRGGKLERLDVQMRYATP
jgi:hypothetical protein